LEEEPEDLIGHDEEATEEQGGESLYFRWYPSLKKYVMVAKTDAGYISIFTQSDYDTG
jgi:hypothetical protein